MDALSRVGGAPLCLSFNRRASLSRPNSHVTIGSSSAFSRSSYRAIKASSSSSLPVDPEPKRENVFLYAAKTLIRPTCIALTAAASAFVVFSMTKPMIACPVPIIEHAEDSKLTEEETERLVEKKLELNPDEVGTLKDLFALKMKLGNFEGAHSVLDRLITLEDDQMEWRLMKAQMFVHHEEYERAKALFEEIAERAPLRADAYNGLLVIATQLNNSSDVKMVTRRVKESMGICERRNDRESLRDLKLVMAQIMLYEGKYMESKLIYEELVKDEDDDCRPYICLGIVHNLLGDKESAQKAFSEFRRHLPRDSPYASVLDEAVLAAEALPEIMKRQNPIPDGS